MPTLAGFVGFGYLRAEGCRALGLDRNTATTDAAQVVDWIKRRAAAAHREFLRVYWYDGAFDPREARPQGRRASHAGPPRWGDAHRRA